MSGWQSSPSDARDLPGGRSGGRHFSQRWRYPSFSADRNIQSSRPGRLDYKIVHLEVITLTCVSRHSPRVQVDEKSPYAETGWKTAFGDVSQDQEREAGTRPANFWRRATEPVWAAA